MGNYLTHMVLLLISREIVVPDQGNHRIQICNSQGQLVRKFGSKGAGNGQLNSPVGVGLLSNGNIVVSECDGNRLQIFDSQGKFVRIVGAGQFKYPIHLFVDSDDNILVADQDNKCIQVFTRMVTTSRPLMW